MTSDVGQLPGKDVVGRARALLDECGIDASGMTDDQAATRARQIAEWGTKFISPLGDRYSAIVDGRITNLFTHGGVDALVEHIADEPRVVMAPVAAVAAGREQVEDFYREDLLGGWPSDVKVTPVSRTVGERQVVEEIVLDFTHEVEMPALFPGVAPTGRHVSLAFIIIIGFDPATGRVTHEHVHWDQGSALVQLGLIDPDGLPVWGVEQTHKLLDENALPSNLLIFNGTSAASRRTP